MKEEISILIVDDEKSALRYVEFIILSLGYTEVSVHGTVYPGVYIEICYISYVVGREMSNVSFKLNKVKGKIAVN